MRLVPLTPELLRLLPLRDPRASRWMSDGYVRAVAIPGLSFAALDGGYIHGAGGLVPIWPGRAIAWMLAGVFARPRHFLRGAAFTRAWLDEMQARPEFRRIECHVLARFEPGLRFAEALGFVRETPPLEAWDPDGNDHIQFKRMGGLPSGSAPGRGRVSRAQEHAA